MAAFVDDRKYKDEDYGGFVSPFDGIEKGSVLQECRIFNDLHLDTSRCENVLVRLLYLVGQGEKLSREEATEVFFSVTKLFQSAEPSLRRLVYLAIKELAHTAEEVIIVTNCLTKDINSDVDMYRANATRVLCKITDAQLVQAIERYLKQEIVDRNPVVASAALVSGQQLISHNKGDVVRRWVNEITQALDHNDAMVEYHALALLYQIKSHDRLAVSKLVQSLARSGGRSPMATVLLVRYVAMLELESPPRAPGEPRPYFDFLSSSLRHRSDIVVYEAARSIVSIPNVTAAELMPVISVLQLFLVQNKAVLRMAAMRTLARISMTHPVALGPCQTDMESLIGDSNRSIATLAITTLLRTGSESSIERLLKQIQNFLSEIADVFKIKIVDAIQTLCIKYPNKYYTLLNFLGSALREEGGFEFKRAIVNTYVLLMDKIPECKDQALNHCAEFIEDCEHTLLSTQILHMLGREGPKMPDPGKFIRYIYNRLILENATVRAAAVSALGRFGDQGSEELRHSVKLLLTQSLMDVDDEVRDRAAFAIEALNKKSVSPDHIDVSVLPCPLANLEADLIHYVTSSNTSTAFSLDTVSKAAIYTAPVESEKRRERKAGLAAAPSKPPPPKDLAENVMKVPQLSSLGRPFKSNPAVELTEAEFEYTVKCLKHVYPTCTVLEFVIENTLNDQLLENVVVDVDTSDMAGVAEVTLIEAPKLPYAQPASAYTVLVGEPETYLQGNLQCTLKYTVRDVDPATGVADDGGFPDDIQLMDLTIGVSDLVAAPAELPKSFKSAWDLMGDANELADSCTLSAFSTVPAAVPAVMSVLGLVPCEGSDNVSERASSHILLLTGIVVPGSQVMARAQISASGGSVDLNVLIRSDHPQARDLILSNIA
mmetsp:Transcript_2747/g.5006  ORF Transcript_2747/g.5006 Transcript_2747/m.5006 type:complete len:886 (-) Transcript_2747:1030-3687(-)